MFFPYLHEKERLVREFLVERKLSFQVKNHSNGHVLVVEGVKYSSWQDFLVKKTVYKVAEAEPKRKIYRA